MKRLLLAAVSTVAFMTAGSAFAGNVATIDQIGTAENAGVDQTGSSGGSTATVTQGNANTDGYNQASVVQGGASNTATVTQSQGVGFGEAVPSNVAGVNQQGVGGLAIITQVGNSTASVSQTATA